MSSMEFTISDDIFEEGTGIYTCKIYFPNDIDQSVKDRFIKKHIMSLNYEEINYVFLPEFGSKVSAALSAENKNIVNLKILFVKIEVDVNFVKSFEKSNSSNGPPPPPPRNRPPPATLLLDSLGEVDPSGASLQFLADVVAARRSSHALAPPPPRNKPFPNSSNLDYFSFSDLKTEMWIKELQNHPEYASLNSHQYYSSFQDAILSCSSEQAKENTYKFYCEN